MRVVTGSIIRCDPALKEYLMALKRAKPEVLPGTEMELDAEHIFITADKMEILKRLQPEIDYWIQSNTYAGDDVDEFDININPNSVVKLT